MIDDFKSELIKLPPNEVAVRMLQRRLLSCEEYQRAYATINAPHNRLGYDTVAAFLLECLQNKPPGYLKTFYEVLEEVEATHIASKMKKLYQGIFTVIQ